MESDGEKTIPFLILSRTFYSSHRFENTFVFNLICSFIMASITDYAHRIRFEKVKDTHFTSSSRFQGHPFIYKPRPKLDLAMQTTINILVEENERWLLDSKALVAGAWTEREKMFHGGSFLKLADDNMDIQNPEAQNRVFSGF